MIHLDGTLRTDEMDFVAFLHLRGYKLVMEQVRPGKVEWVLSREEVEVDQEFLEEVVSNYRSGSELIEPKRFYRELRTVREELYDLLKHRAVRVSHQAQPHGSQ